MTVLEMAEAHLNTVAKAIVDLQNQKNAIEQEINKLNEYLQLGREEVTKARSNVVKSVE
jgi:predicted  nucleic acid-binding Zn-ribbon protein